MPGHWNCAVGPGAPWGTPRPERLCFPRHTQGRLLLCVPCSGKLPGPPHAPPWARGVQMRGHVLGGRPERPTVCGEGGPTQGEADLGRCGERSRPPTPPAGLPGLPGRRH